jgi:hypothetical protein
MLEQPMGPEVLLCFIPQPKAPSEPVDTHFDVHLLANTEGSVINRIFAGCVSRLFHHFDRMLFLALSSCRLQLKRRPEMCSVSS